MECFYEPSALPRFYWELWRQFLPKFQWEELAYGLNKRKLKWMSLEEFEKNFASDDFLHVSDGGDMG